jgi:hypothetical protein
MAKAARIDDVIKHADGHIEVRYTEGDAPLPASWSGLSEQYGSVEQFVAALSDSETATAEHLKRIQVAKGYKADPTLGATFLNAVKNKTATLDLTGQVATITLG